MVGEMDMIKWFLLTDLSKRGSVAALHTTHEKERNTFLCNHVQLADVMKSLTSMLMISYQNTGPVRVKSFSLSVYKFPRINWQFISSSIVS